MFAVRSGHSLTHSTLNTEVFEVLQRGFGNAFFLQKGFVGTIHFLSPHFNARIIHITHCELIGDQFALFAFIEFFRITNYISSRFTSEFSHYVTQQPTGINSSASIERDFQLLAWFTP